jgi:RNA polymerase sigma-70 factor (ECF subfamily)
MSEDPMDEALSIVGGAGDVHADDDGLARAAATDAPAFGAIYERHRTAVYRYLRSRTVTDDEAAELTAITFERALTAIGGFRASGGGLAAWLLRIARNAHLDTIRRDRRRWAADDRRPVAPLPDRQAGPEDGVVLRALVDALPAVQRDAIQLRFAAGLTAREIGCVLGISEGAAQKQLERALHALKEAFHVR